MNTNEIENQLRSISTALFFTNLILGFGLAYFVAALFKAL